MTIDDGRADRRQAGRIPRSEQVRVPSAWIMLAHQVLNTSERESTRQAAGVVLARRILEESER